MTRSRPFPFAGPAGFAPFLATVLPLLLATACGPASSRGGDATVEEASPEVADLPQSDAPQADAVDLPSTAPCTVLFGLPNEKTGLTDAQCRPSCDCEGRRFEPPAYTQAQIAAIEAMVLLDTLPSLDEDPYAHPEQHVPVEGAVCGVLLDAAIPGAYRLKTYDGVDAARADGAIVTHESACGLCSPLPNLAVYMRHPDLTDPVRQCGINGMIAGEEEHLRCLRDLGFDEGCTRIWYYNTLHTQAKCGSLCMELLDAPYHDPDGDLNACLLCDEQESGPVFKAVAGRNRRNTGLPSSMCRPCAEVLPIVHEYR